MSHSGLKSRFAEWCVRFAKIPTAFHLWCAERELRSACPRELSPSRHRKRHRNLELLRNYRLSGEFPRNHAPNIWTPCFIDSAGRQCAVAFLMHESGAKEAALKVARHANDARIADMHFPELDDWASESGLTHAELARIQPVYPGTPEEALEYARTICLVWTLVALAAYSIVFNLGRLILAQAPRLTTMSAGFLLGAAVLCAAFQIGLVDLSWKLRKLQNMALGVGILSVACAVVPFFARRGKWRQTDAVSDPPTPEPESPQNEHFKAADIGIYRSKNSSRISEE